MLSPQTQPGSSSSLRRQPTYPPAASSHSSYRLHESSALFGSTPNLYAYPASAALASVSQAVDQMQGCSSHHSRVGGAYSSLALLQKSSSLTLPGSVPAQYAIQQQQQQHHALGVQASQRSSAAYQRKLNQFPYQWRHCAVAIAISGDQKQRWAQGLLERRTNDFSLQEIHFQNTNGHLNHADISSSTAVWAETANHWWQRWDFRF